MNCNSHPETEERGALAIRVKPGKLSVEPPSPAAVRLWAERTEQAINGDSEAMLLIRDLQARVHRLESLVRAYGLALQEKLPAQLQASAGSGGVPAPVQSPAMERVS